MNALDVVLKRKIESALLSEPNIVDCVIVSRRSYISEDEFVVYFVPNGPVNQGELHDRVTALLGRKKQTVHFLPLFKLPLTFDGSLDWQALANIPVIDDSFINQGESTLRSQQGIKNSALVRMQLPNSDASRYHLSDILPEPSSGCSQKAGTSISPSVKLAATGEPALVNGSALLERAAVEHMTLPDLLRKAAAEFNNRVIRFVTSKGDVSEWSYHELLARSERIHSGLNANGLQPDDKVVFQMHANADILSAFWACQLGGYIPVIMEVPTAFQAGNQALERVIGVLQLLNYPLLVTDATAAASYAKADAIPDRDKLRICLIESLKNAEPKVTEHQALPEDVAFFNLSSGSTGVPKCIMLTHRNLLTRAAGTNQLCGYSSSDVILNWLPFDHIGSISDWHVRCVLLGCDLVYVDKSYVLGNPLNWVNLIDRFRVTHSWAPNFAFSLVNKQLDAEQLPGWNLSCVKGLLTAGEAVSDSSVQNFIRLLSKFGLKSTAVQPAFGMAELGSGITYFVPSESNPLRFHTVRKPSVGEAIEWVDEVYPEATHFADLGPPIPGVSLRIINNEGQVLPVETVGRLQIKGDVVFQGYFSNPDANAAAFSSDGWFNTGDLGFLTKGNLVLTGREKETIIIKGANYYSHELEELAAQVDGVAASFTAACGVRRIMDDEEKLALFFVAERTDDEADLIRAVRTQIANRFGISPAYLIPLVKHQIPKTAIGKIQRTQLKQRLEIGEYDAIIKRVDLLLGNANTLPKWFYRPVWLPKQAMHSGNQAWNGAVLIVMDGCGLGSSLLGRLQAHGYPVVTVTPGVEFAKLDRHAYVIDLSTKENFVELFRQLTEEGIGVGQVVALIDYRLPQSGVDVFEAGDYPSLTNVAAFLNLVQAVLEIDAIEPLKRIVWVTSDSQCLGAGDLGNPVRAMMTGFTRTLCLERPDIDCCHVDLASAEHENNAELLGSELFSLSKEASVSYRNGHRHVYRIEKLDLLEKGDLPHDLKPGGLYLVTGGLGGLGYELCRRLGRQYRARIVIVGRSVLPMEDAEPNDPVVTLQRRYRTLIEEGIECSYLQADVADRSAVKTLVEQAENRWGKALDGIFHLAGIAHEASLDRESLDGYKRLARPKCEGILSLGEILRERSGAILVAFSSVNASFGGSSAGGYSAANVFMAAVCRQLQRQGHAAHYYEWSQWDGVGMNSHSATKAIAAAKGFRPIGPEEGMHSLFAVLHQGYSEAIIGLDANKSPIQIMLADQQYSRQSATAFVELDVSSANASIPETLSLQDRFGSSLQCPIEAVAELPMTKNGQIDKDRLMGLSGEEHHTKKKPKNAVEIKLIEMWQEVLHVSDIGTQDNFFELGGDSLLTVQLAVRISKAFHREIPASTLFHAPTVEQLAAVLAEQNTTPDLFSLVPIKASGSKPPLYIIQSDSWELVRHLDSDQPVYGLNYGVGAKTEESKLKLPETLEDLAKHFIEEIQTRQPSGPYYLLGHSNAGILAYEMAQQLVQRNEEVGMLGMVDTWYLPDREGQPDLSVVTKLMILAKLPLNTSLLFIRNRIAYQVRLIKNRLFTKTTELPFLHRAMHLYKAYQPKPYSGNISYFKCFIQTRIQPIGKDELAWEKLADEGVRLHLIACDHQEVLFEPFVKLLAEQINRNL